MWDRRELKARGKAALHANYWLTVIVAFILALVAGGGSGAAAGVTVHGANLNLLSSGNEVTGFSDAPFDSDFTFDSGEIGSAFNHIGDVFNDSDVAGFAVAVLIVGIMIAVIAFAFSLLLDILLRNPIEVGCQNFFIRNSEGQAALNDLERGFKPNWKNIVKTMFLRDLYLFLWGLLFLIPGIIKGYSYRMVPYILADHPEWSGNEVITLSRQMMRGQKWRAFVLDLSFLGWELLSLFTIGLLSILYVRPYRACTNAELYQALQKELPL